MGKRINVARLSVAVALMLAAGQARAAKLSDSTPIPVRLDGVINSETSKAGEALAFVVTTDVRVGDEVVIPKGSMVKGVIVKVKSAKWGFMQREPKLTFRFTAVVARDGHVITLRSSPSRHGADAVAIPRRTNREHELLWVGGADIFQAYVEGDYDI